MESSLTNEIAVAALRGFQIARLDKQLQWEEELQARADRPPVWGWSEGVFVFPEALCCYCGGVMGGPVLWKVDKLQFVGSWKVVRAADGTGYLSYRTDHPHVNAGSICMGGGTYHATSVADALFLAFNPLSSYFGDITEPDPNDPENRSIVVQSTNQRIKAWFKDRFDHTCGFSVGVATVAGIDNRHAIAPEENCHCHHCRAHREEVKCPREQCGQWFAVRRGHGKYACTECYRMLGVSRTRRYCYKHVHDFQLCSYCEDNFDLNDIATGKPADPVPIAPCKDCKGLVCRNCTGENEGMSQVHHCVDNSGEDEDEEPCDCRGCRGDDDEDE